LKGSAQLESPAPSLVQKLEKLSAPLARVKQNSEWDLTNTVRQAVRIVEDMQTHGMTIDDLVRQQGFDDSRNNMVKLFEA